MKYTILYPISPLIHCSCVFENNEVPKLSGIPLFQPISLKDVQSRYCFHFTTAGLISSRRTVFSMRQSYGRNDRCRTALRLLIKRYPTIHTVLFILTFIIIFRIWKRINWVSLCFPISFADFPVPSRNRHPLVGTPLYSALHSFISPFLFRIPFKLR